MRVAFVGCGYAADLYARTFPNHPSLILAGVYDRDQAREEAFARYHHVLRYPSLDALLDDDSVELVVNLTNPASHVEVTSAALLAGRHVYSEKPLAPELAQARELIDLARERDRLLVSAPCNLLSEANQTVWRELRRGRIGTPRLAYLELEAGQIMRLPYRKWLSDSGAPWPYLDEFRTGCTVEHGGYGLSLLTAFFGPATTVTAYSATPVVNAALAAAGEAQTPNFSVACIDFAGGMVARVTSGLVGPKDQSLRIVGDEGVLTVADTGRYESPIEVTYGPEDAPVPVPLLPRQGIQAGYDDYHQLDFARGIADTAAVIAGEHASHLPIDQALHVLELTLAINEANGGAVFRAETSCAPVPPAPWAE